MNDELLLLLLSTNKPIDIFTEMDAAEKIEMIVKNLLTMTNHPVDKIAELVEVPVDFVREVHKNIKGK